MVAKRATSPRSADLRRTILEKATVLFDEVGYHTATMDDLADSVGLAKPSLYYYFKSKDSILFEISHGMILALIANVENRAAVGLTPSQAILEAMADVLEATQSDPRRMRVLVEHTRDLEPSQREIVMKERERYRILLEGLIDGAISAGEMRAGSVPLVARAIFGMCNWAYHWITPDQRPRDIAYLFWDIVNNGLGAPEHRSS